MASKNRHHRLNAESAIRLALGAFYAAEAGQPDDAPDLVGRFMLELSRRLSEDGVVGPHYAEIIECWRVEDNLRNTLKNAQVATCDGCADNPLIEGLENG